MRREKRLGQNFLKDGKILAFEAGLVPVEGKRVVEIGAGDGRLSEKILEKKPGKLVLLEIDFSLAEGLREKFAGRKEVEVLEGDAREVSLEGFDAAFGNIPYYISSDVLFLLARTGIPRAALCVQKEFAERMAAKPGSREYGRLSVTCQACFSVRIARIVPRGAFSPAPKVDSAVVALERKGGPLTGFLEEFVRKIFQHRNQSLKKALSHSFKAKPDLLSGLLHADRKVYTLSIGEIREAAEDFEKILKENSGGVEPLKGGCAPLMGEG